MTKLKKRKYEDDLFSVDVYAMVGGTVQDAIREVGIDYELGDNEMEGFVVADGRRFYIWLRRKTMKIFQHEFTHLVNAIFKAHGATVSIEDDELDARWRGRLAEFIWNTNRIK